MNSMTEIEEIICLFFLKQTLLFVPAYFEINISSNYKILDSFIFKFHSILAKMTLELLLHRTVTTV